MGRRIVVALGGNAILRRGQEATWAIQAANIARVAEQVARVVAAGHDVVLTHGNGPQVGNLLVQNDRAAGVIPPLPLHVLGAATQGWLGYAITQAVDNALNALGVDRPVASVITQVVVDRGDPAFDHPQKPIGPHLSRTQAEALKAGGVAVVEEKGYGWRRVVASPEPRGIVELSTLRALADAGVVLVACGGGGVPVSREGTGYYGVDAVIDKDLSAALLARSVDADTLMLLTDAEGVMLDWGTPRATLLTTLSVNEAAGLLARGQLAAGSMGPKVRAAVEFVTGGNRRAVIGSVDRLEALIEGQTGTVITG
jgi:carbamate kinase